MSNGSSDVRLASCRISCGTGSLQLSPRPLELSLKYCGVVTCSGMARCDTLQTRHFGKCCGSIGLAQGLYTQVMANHEQPSAGTSHAHCSTYIMERCHNRTGNINFVG